MKITVDLPSSHPIANKKVSEALHKQEALQVRERILSENGIGSMVAGRLIWLLGQAELSNIRHILDIGSWHLGQSIEFSNIFSNACINAFEPVPDSYKLCIDKHSNLDDQKKKRIHIHSVALSNIIG